MRTHATVKLILREHVEHLGERGQTVAVKPGFARNYLIPKGLAYLATPGNLKMVEHQRRVWAARDAKEIEQAQAMADALSKVTLSVTKKSGETGTLYGSVTKTEIAQLLKAKGFQIDRRAIGPDDPIKAVGVYEMNVKVFRKVTAKVKLEVVPDVVLQTPPPPERPVEAPESESDTDSADE